MSHDLTHSRAALGTAVILCVLGLFSKEVGLRKSKGSMMKDILTERAMVWSLTAAGVAVGKTVRDWLYQ